jgi:hypothetical protein
MLHKEMWTKSVFCRKFLGAGSVCATLHEALASDTSVSMMSMLLQAAPRQASTR